MVYARRVSACGFTRVSSVFHSGAQRVSFRCAVRSIWVHDAFLFGAQRVRFGVSEGWQRVSFGEPWVRFREGFIVLPSSNLIGRLG